MKDGYGSFGAQASVYSFIRKGFPDEVFTVIKSLTPVLETLDLGCGTGISSRQLAEHGFIVTGSDYDERMIEEAKASSAKYQITYHAAPANTLPFTDNSFDLITAFSAFHWFCDSSSIQEIKRVLKADGLFVAVNKNDSGGGMKEIIKKVIKTLLPADYKLPNAKVDYDPVNILTTAGFKRVGEQVIETVEEYTLAEAVNYTKTMSLFNLLSDDDKPKALAEIEKVLSAQYPDRVTQALKVSIVSGFNAKMG